MSFIYFKTLQNLDIYFLAPGASKLSAASFAFLARSPRSRLCDRATLNSRYAWKFFSSAVGTRAFSITRMLFFRRGITTPCNWVANLSSSAEASPLCGFLALNGNRISRDLYSFSRWAFRWMLSVLLFDRRWSTAIPIAGQERVG